MAQNTLKMENCNALIIGGSAGSIEVLLNVLPGLNSFLDFPIVIVLHRKSGKDNILTDILSTKTQLRVKELEEKEKIKPSTIYLAPPNYHTLIEADQTFSLDASEKVNFSRPSIDVTFESAAEVFKNNLVCLLLSGANNDGTEGLKKVKDKGGKVIIQDPNSAIVRYMPEFAIEHVNPDAVLDETEMAAYINKLSQK